MKLIKYLSITVLSMFLMGNTQCVEKYSFIDVHNKENIPVNYTCK